MTMGDKWRDAIHQMVVDYGSHPAMYGYFIQDEPSYANFRALGQISQELQKQDPRHLPYINLLPTYATPEQLGTPTYDDYLDKFLSIVKPAILSWDHYCLRAGGSDGPEYFENLEKIREHSLSSGVPGWNIIQAMSYDPAMRQPSDAEMRWQVFTSLAYGIKGIMYFIYWSYNDKPAEVGIVDNLGRPAKLFAPVRQLNGEMKNLGKILLGLTSTGVYHTGQIPIGAMRLGNAEALRLPDDKPLVVGFFKARQGPDQYAMIVNNDHNKPVDFAVTLKEHVVGLTEISARDMSEMPAKIVDHQVALHLEPGDGKLFRLTTSFAYPEPPALVTKVDFQFNKDGDIEGWGEQNSLTDLTVQGGILTMTFAGADPYICREWLSLTPDQYTKIKVRMKLPKCDPNAQFFWTTSDEPTFADNKYLGFPVQPDGQWHEYKIPVGTHAKWKGKAIRGIRLDPTTGNAAPGSKVEVDWIKGE